MINKIELLNNIHNQIDNLKGKRIIPVSIIISLDVLKFIQANFIFEEGYHPSCTLKECTGDQLLGLRLVIPINGPEKELVQVTGVPYE